MTPNAESRALSRWFTHEKIAPEEMLDEIARGVLQAEIEANIEHVLSQYPDPNGRRSAAEIVEIINAVRELNAPLWKKLKELR
jgi:hypothetical protein